MSLERAGGALRFGAVLVAGLVALSACSPAGGMHSSDAGQRVEDAGQRAPDAGPMTFVITVAPNGAFSPALLHLRVGDTVEWRLSRSDAVIPASGPAAGGACLTPRAWDPADFAGPMPFAPSGIFTLSPLDRGLTVEAGSCSSGRPRAMSGTDVLCESGLPQATMDSTWQDPAVSGVFLRLEWSAVQPRPGPSGYDFSVLDREVSQAVRTGKLYSVGIKAGASGTPDWIFSTNPDGTVRANGGGGVQRLRLQDAGSSPTGTGCGSTMDLGSPTDPVYQLRYFELLTAVARHLKSRADWYRALALFKPSGANLFSHENRLPRRCDPGCICNTRLFAQAGYTPAGLYGFFQAQLALLAAELPGKAFSYALIQDGFPAVNDSGDYEQEDGTSSGGPLPRGTEQTEVILQRGKAALGASFTVQHNGLGQIPPPGTCPNEGLHPAVPPYAQAGAGCPNRWVLQSGADGLTVTGFQTNNASGVSNPAEVERALENDWLNSDGAFVELYEERVWEVRSAGAVLPSGKTLSVWGDDLHARRGPEGLPLVVRHLFDAPGVIDYFNPRACGVGNAQLVVDP